MTSIMRMAISCVLFMGVSAPCRADDFKQANTSENLKALCERLQSAIAKKDTSTINAVGNALVPDAARLKKGLRDDVPAGDISTIQEMHAKFKQAAGNDMSKLFNMKPDQSSITVHAATTEELASYAKNSIAWQHFPGGAQRVAGKVLRPGMTYYEVEFVKPGEKAGMKYHLFYWDGNQWAMLGPLWRAFR